MNQAIIYADSALMAYQTDDEGIHVVWKELPCQDYEQLMAESPDLQVWSSITDSDGLHGSPVTFTLWGDEMNPYLATALNYEGGNPSKCHHAVAISVERTSVKGEK